LGIGKSPALMPSKRHAPELARSNCVDARGGCDNQRQLGKRPRAARSPRLKNRVEQSRILTGKVAEIPRRILPTCGDTLARVRFLILAVALISCREPSSAPPPTPPGTAIALTTASPLAPTAQPATYDTSCNQDWECVPAPGCCPAPCSSLVINARDEPRARADLHCDPAAQCPSAGGCETFAYLCLAHTCKILFANEPGFRKRESAP
jgi:hypothetical protein